MNSRSILEMVKNGTMSVEEAEAYFMKKPYEDMGFAKLDSHREIRSGFPEVIFCAGKPDDYLVSIFKSMYETNGEAFGTRASREQYELVKCVIPEIEYDKIDKVRGMDINFITTANTDEEAKELLTLMGAPFAK